MEKETNTEKPLLPQQRDYKKYLFQYNSTPEQRLANAKKAGEASKAARQQYKRQGEILRQILAMNCDDTEAAAALQGLGLDPSFANAANLAVIHRALRGDVEALRYVRDTIGEKPADTTRVDVRTRPVGAQDLTQLTDEELELLADQAAEAEQFALAAGLDTPELPAATEQEVDDVDGETTGTDDH